MSEKSADIHGKGRQSAFIFDLDGTLVDSVYPHVLAWKEALRAVGVELDVWRIHRRIGMSGGLMANAILRETGRAVTRAEAQKLLDLHREAYVRHAGSINPLTGAKELLQYLSKSKIPWTIATSARLDTARPTLDTLGVPRDMPLITRDKVERAKPDPDLFLAAADLLKMNIGDCIIVGDSVWDLLGARRAGGLGVGLLSGGYGRDELERAGAYRVYEDPADLLRHLDEVGVRTEAI